MSLANDMPAKVKLVAGRRSGWKCEWHMAGQFISLAVM